MDEFSTLKDFYDNTIDGKKVFCGLQYNKTSEIISLVLSDTEDDSLAMIATNKQKFSYDDLNKIISYFNIRKVKYGEYQYEPKENRLIIDRDWFGYNNVSIRQKLFLFKKTFLVDSLISLKKENVLAPVCFIDNQRIFDKKEYLIHDKSYNLIPVFTDSHEIPEEQSRDSLLLIRISELVSAIKNKKTDADGIYINPGAKSIPGINSKSLNLVISKALIKSYL